MGKVLYMRKGSTHSKPGSRLPSGYTELAYIQSSGTQHIDTGFKPNQNTGVTIDFQLNVASDWQCIFGTRVGANTRSYSLWHSGSAFGFYYSSVNATFSNLGGTVRHTVVASKNTAVADGASSVSPAYSNFTANYSLFLFAVHSDGQPQSIASMKLYSCQIYDNGTLVRDFVPCINESGEVGLFDMVERKFYGNAGTGAFGAGDVVDYSLPDGYEELAYIQSSGTQYVDTGFKPNNNTRVVMDVELPVQGSYPKGLFGVRDATSGNKNSFLMWVYDQSFNTGFATVGKAISLTTSGRFTVDKNKTANIINGTPCSADTASTFQSSYSLLLLALMNSNGVDSRMVSGKLYSCQIYDDGACVRWYVPVVNASGSVGLYDVITRAFYGNAGTGAFIGSEVA